MAIEGHRVFGWRRRNNDLPVTRIARDGFQRVRQPAADPHVSPAGGDVQPGQLRDRGPQVGDDGADPHQSVALDRPQGDPAQST